jgi:hypothetical protein
MNFVNDEEMKSAAPRSAQGTAHKDGRGIRDSTKARNQLVTGLSHLRDTAKRLAVQEATELVQRFGEMAGGSSTWRLNC